MTFLTYFMRIIIFYNNSNNKRILISLYLVIVSFWLFFLSKQN